MTGIVDGVESTALRPRASHQPAPVLLDHLGLIAELASDLVYQTNLAGIIEWVSPSVKQVLGWAPEEVLGIQSLDFIHPDDVPTIRSHRVQMDAGQAIDDHLTRFRSKSGAHRWMSVRFRPITDEAGAVIARVVAAHDVHDETTVRKALNTLSQGNGVLVRATSETGLLQLMCDTIVESGRYLFACYRRPLHDRAKSVKTVAFSGDHHGYLDRFTSTWEDAVTGQGPTGVALRTGQIQVSQDFLRDPLLAPWASAASTAGISSSIALPVFFEGRLDGVLVVYGAEVDEFNQVARAPLADLANALSYGLTQLREHARTRAIIDSLMDPHVLLDPVRDKTGWVADFVYLDANRAACDYMGKERSQLIGERLLGFLPGHARDGTLAMYANVVDSGQPLVLDTYPYANEILGSLTFADIRAIQVGDALSLTWRDITERYAAGLALAASEEQYRLLAENSSDVVLRLEQGLLKWVSPSITDMLGWIQSDLLGRSLEELVHAEDLDEFRACQVEIKAERPHRSRFRMRAKDLTYHWVDLRAKPYLDAKGERDGAVASFHTIDTQVAAEAALERRARYDELTGLLKRNDIFEQLSSMSSRTQRTGDKVAVMFCDIDQFKGVNDANGHAVGDEVLRSIASRIEGSVRRGDLIARIGGDEFLVILDGVHDLNEAIRIAEKLRREVARPIQVTSGTVTTTISIGVTLARPDEDVAGLITRADQAMYGAKKAGSNQVIAISSALD